MERNAAVANITCASTLGGKGSKSSLNGLYRLSCRGKNDMWFDVMEQYGDLGTFLSVISLISIILYFVTSSDSGSLVIDCLSANGDPEPPVIQRIFWALTEGATATALLNAGGNEGLAALQSMAIASGVPYTILLCFMCVALWRAVKMEGGDLDPRGPQFTTSLLDVFSKPTKKSVGGILLAVIAPWYPMGNAAYKIERGKHARWWYMTIMAVLFYLWVILMALEPAVDFISYVGWAFLMGFFSYATAIRYAIRLEYNIYGNSVEDFFAVMVLYPFAAYQMEHHMDNTPLLDPPSDDMANANDMEKAKSGTANGMGHAYQMDNPQYYMDRGYGADKDALESGNWTPSMSLQNLSDNGPHYNPGMDNDTVSRQNPYWSKTELI